MCPHCTARRPPSSNCRLNLEGSEHSCNPLVSEKLSLLQAGARICHRAKGDTTHCKGLQSPTASRAQSRLWSRVAQLKASPAAWRWNRLLADSEVCTKLPSLSFPICHMGMVNKSTLNHPGNYHKHKLLCVQGWELAWHQLCRSLEVPGTGCYNHCHWSCYRSILSGLVWGMPRSLQFQQEAMCTLPGRRRGGGGGGPRGPRGSWGHAAHLDKSEKRPQA